MPNPVFAIPPAVNLHAFHSNVITSGGRVTSISDLQGLADAANTTGTGPFLITDALGWKFMRGQGSEYLSGATSFVSRVQRVTTIALVRYHRMEPQASFSLGSVEGGTRATTGPAFERLLMPTSNQSSAYLASSVAGLPTYDANKAAMVPGSQWQVVMVRSTPTAVITAINGVVASSAPNSNLAFDLFGYELFRNAGTIDALAPGTFAKMDVGQRVIYNSDTLTDEQALAAMTTMMAAYGITAPTKTVVIDGDSIMFSLQGSSGSNVAMQITNRGSPISLPANTRVLNVAVSGNTTDDVALRLANSNSVYNERLGLSDDGPVFLKIGTNNLDATGNQTPEQARDALATLLATYFARGLSVRLGTTIAYNNSGVQSKIEQFRALINSSAFFDLVQANTGQPNFGKLSIVDLAEYTLAGDTKFKTLADAQDTAVYVDGVHPTDLGNAYMAEVISAGIQNPAPPPLPPPPAASGYVASSVTSVSSGTSITINVPIGAAAGDLLVVWAVSGTGADFNTPAGWTDRLTSSGFAVRSLGAWDGSTGNYTFTMAASSPAAVIMMAFKNFDFDQVSTLSSATANPTPGSITVGENGCINFTLVGGVGASRTYSMPAGWTARNSNTTSRSVAAFQRDALVNAGALAGVQATLVSGTGNSRAVQFSVGPR